MGTTVSWPERARGGRVCRVRGLRAGRDRRHRTSSVRPWERHEKSAETRLVRALAVLATSCSVGNRSSPAAAIQLYRNVHLAPTLEDVSPGNRYSRATRAATPRDQAWFEPAERAYVGAAWNASAPARLRPSAPDGPSVGGSSAGRRAQATIGFAAKRRPSREPAWSSRCESRASRRAAQGFLEEWAASFERSRAFEAGTSRRRARSRSSRAIRRRRWVTRCVGDSARRPSRRVSRYHQEEIVPARAAYSLELVSRTESSSKRGWRSRALSRVVEALDRRAVSSRSTVRAEGIRSSVDPRHERSRELVLRLEL